MMTISADLFTLTLFLSCLETNASVITTRTDDLISVNEHLYDPDLYGSVYQETSKKKRLYLAPGLSKLEKALDNGSFDIDVFNDIPKQIKENSVSDIADIDKTISLLKQETTNSEKDFQKESKLGLFPEKNREDIEAIKDELRNYNQRSRRWPTKRRTWSKFLDRQGKRYKAGVADRLAHGFGKRSAFNTINLGDIQKIIENDLNFHGDPSHEGRSVRGIAKLILKMAAGRGQEHGDNRIVRKPPKKSLEDILKELLRANGAVDDGEGIKDEIIL